MNGKFLALVGAALLLGGCRAVMGLFTPEGRDPQAVRRMEGSWCSLGTFVTWFDGHAEAGGSVTNGYQTFVRQRLTFNSHTNCAVLSGGIEGQLGHLARADYYTIEHGISDWMLSTPVGTLEDYLDNTSNRTFSATYRRLVEEIRTLNPDATIIVCTPRRAFGANGRLPAHWYLSKNGIKLEDYAKVIRAIAAEEGFVVADYFKNSGHNENQLRLTSADVALQPNDLGYLLMANETLRAFAKVD